MVIYMDPFMNKRHVSFGGIRIETTVTYSGSRASDWVEQMTARYGARPTAVGLDVEWWHYSDNGRRNPVATLQLCIDNNCLILQLLHMDYIPYSINQFLINPNFTFVGVGIDQDVSKLRIDYGLDCIRTMDVRAEALSRWPSYYSRQPIGLKRLAWELCRLRMEKPQEVTMSKWDAYSLSDAQIDYGCIDAYASFKIGEYLLSYY